MYVVLYYLYQAKAVKLSALLIEYFLHKNSSDAFPSYYQLIIPARGIIWDTILQKPPIDGKQQSTSPLRAFTPASYLNKNNK